MPSLSKIWTWDSTVEGWVRTDLSTTFSAVPGDGDPNPGCVSLVNALGNGGGSVKFVGTWEDLGVPAGAAIQTVACSFFYRRTANDGINPAQVRASGYMTLVSNPSNVQLITVVDITTLDAWQQVSAAPIAVNSSFRASNTNINFVAQSIVFLPFSDGTGWTAFFDTYQLDITYTGGLVTTSGRFGGVGLLRATLTLATPGFPNGGWMSTRINGGAGGSGGPAGGGNFATGSRHFPILCGPGPGLIACNTPRAKGRRHA